MGSGGLRLQPAYSSQGTVVSSASESGRGVRVAIHLHEVPRLRINSATILLHARNNYLHPDVFHVPQVTAQLILSYHPNSI